MGSNSIEQALNDLSQVPCPPWCERPHMGEWLILPFEPTRTHTTAETRIGRVTVYVEGLERAAESTGWHPEYPEGICIAIDADASLTAAEARQLAAGLMNAADLLDRIQPS